MEQMIWCKFQPRSSHCCEDLPSTALARAKHETWRLGNGCLFVGGRKPKKQKLMILIRGVACTTISDRAKISRKQEPSFAEVLDGYESSTCVHTYIQATPADCIILHPEAPNAIGHRLSHDQRRRREALILALHHQVPGSSRRVVCTYDPQQ